MAASVLGTARSRLPRASHICSRRLSLPAYNVNLEDKRAQGSIISSKESSIKADMFPVQDLFSLRDLFDAKVHLGHKAGLRNPYMAPYVFGCRLGVDIFNLDKTVSYLEHALSFVAHVAHRGGIVLFISRNRQTMPLIEQTARECNEYAHCRYWKGGIFTNSAVQYNAVTRLPDVCVMLHTLTNAFEPHPAIRDCAKLGIPTVAVVDTDCDPRYITYPIPGNDDSPDAVSMYCRLFKESVLLGKRKRQAESGLDDTRVPAAT